MNFVKLTVYGRQPKRNDLILKSYSTQLPDLEGKSYSELRAAFREKVGIVHELILRETIFVNDRAMKFDETYSPKELDSLEYEAIIVKGNTMISKQMLSL